MWYYLWILHYSLAKKAYRKRTRVKKGAWNLSITCSALLFLSILILSSNKLFIGNVINSGIVLAPIGGLIGVLITIPLIYLCQKVPRIKKIKTFRIVIKQTKNIKQWHAILYACLYAALYLFSLFLLISTIPNHHK
jgi:hypothetical protein